MAATLAIPIGVGLGLLTLGGIGLLIAGVHQTVRRTQAREIEWSGTLLHLQDAERAYLARELHDDLGQRLSAIRLALAEGTPPSILAELDLLHHRLRDLSHEMEPGSLLHCPLGDAIRELCVHTAEWTTHEVVVSWDAALDQKPQDDATNLHLYRLVQGALGNAVHHAQAHRIEVRGTLVDPGASAKLRVEVHDDGCGFVVPNPVSTFGLRSLQARATILGASLTIRSAPGRGTTIEVLLPLAPNGS